MHPFWLKRSALFFVEALAQVVQNPFFETQIISNRKYSNPLFFFSFFLPLTNVMVLGNRNSVVKRTGMRSPRGTRVSDFRQRCCLSTPTVGKRLRTQSTGFVRDGLGMGGGMFFPLSRGLVRSLLEWMERFLLAWGLFEVGSSKVLTRKASPRADGDRSGTCWWCPGCPSIARGPWRRISSERSVLALGRRGAREVSTQG